MHWLTILTLGFFKPTINGEADVVEQQGEQIGRMLTRTYFRGMHRGANEEAQEIRQMMGVDTLEEEDAPLELIPGPYNWEQHSWPELSSAAKGLIIKGPRTRENVVKALQDARPNG
jgi:hypothetical protein